MDYAKEYDGLIFDCDGTLSDSMPLHYVAWRDTMAGYGIDISLSRFYAMGGMPSQQIIEILSSEQAIDVDAPTAAAEKEAAFERLIDQLEPIEAVCAIAREHHGRMPMAVASGGIAPVIRKQLQQLGIMDLFDTVVTAEDTARHKPEPDVFLEAARRLRVRAHRCLVFEDSPLGFQAADAAGMKWVDVREYHKSSIDAEMPGRSN